MGRAETQIGILSRKLRALAEEQEADAAVALLLRVANRRLEVLFVKRVKRSTDPWSGQIALPGGKREDADESLMKTVVRETFEETGIDLLQRCRFLGVMATVNSAVEPRLRVLPFVIFLESEPAIRLNKRELEWSTWLPLDKLSKFKGTVEFNFGQFPAYVVGSSVIWGLTYRIIESLLCVLK